jgi:hypothetical protein
MLKIEQPDIAGFIGLSYPQTHLPIYTLYQTLLTRLKIAVIQSDKGNLRNC